MHQISDNLAYSTCLQEQVQITEEHAAPGQASPETEGGGPSKFGASATRWSCSPLGHGKPPVLANSMTGRAKSKGGTLRRSFFFCNGDASWQASWVREDKLQIHAAQK
jgi:hypothetical protein